MTALALLLLLTSAVETPAADTPAAEKPAAEKPNAERPDAAKPAAKDTTDERWSVISIAGNDIGYEVSSSSEDGDTTVAESASELSMKRFGQGFEMKMSTRVEADTDGRMKSFRMEMRSAGQPPQISSGTVEGDTLTISTPAGAGTQTRTMTLGKDVYSPVYLETLLEELPAKGETKSAKMFAVETLRPVTMTVTGLGPQKTTGRDGKPVTLTAVKVERDDMPLVTTMYFDEESEPVKVDTGMMQMVSWSATREEALKAAGGSDFDFGVRSLLRVTPKPGLETAASARYLVKGGDLPELAGSQELKRQGDTTLVTVMTPTIAGEDATDGAGAEYLASTRWVDWKTPEVSALAEKLPKTGTAGDRALAAEKLVRETITESSYEVGFASAGETAKAKEGDCTEHGVLLAGVLRAAGIPARVSYGFIYVDGAAAMVPHMWTEAYVGDGWKPLDATRPGAPDAGYLKFGDSSLESDGALPSTDLLKLSQSVDTLSVEILETSDRNLQTAD